MIAVLLSLTLMLGSVVDAVARSEMAGASDIALCGAAGRSTLLIDATGQPLPKRQICTHCLAAAVAAVVPATTRVSAPMVGVVAVLRPVLSVVLRPAQVVTPSARGPPVWI